jgi:hypothetical protein
LFQQLFLGRSLLYFRWHWKASKLGIRQCLKVQNLKFNLPLILLILIAVFFIYRWTEISRIRQLEFHYPLRNEPLSSARAEIELRETKDRKFLQKVFIFSGLLLIWQGIWTPTSNYNYEMEQSKIQYDAYLSGYENGWDDQCSAIFSRLGGSGNLAFGRAITITYPQCNSLKLATASSESFSEHIGGYIRDSSAYEMRESGRKYADDDVLTKLFSLSPYWCFGVECVTEKDFGIFRP